MKKRSEWVWTGMILATFLTSCGLFETRERVVGTVSSYGTLPVVDVPREVQQGASFTATVITQGGGCMEQGDIEVKIQRLRAEVTPYDYLDC